MAGRAVSGLSPECWVHAQLVCVNMVLIRKCRPDFKYTGQVTIRLASCVWYLWAGLYHLTLVQVWPITYQI